ncbi:MAG: DUF2268 domain-containing putative Zn-dependent protease [Leptolyngbya sp. IPPAS B-1204]|nr:MAG: hypothetical protein EDM05_33335 [Leptolyngbya sp. IPPAS B-1204]
MYRKSSQRPLVTEGLACHFEAELRPGTIPFYASALEETAISDLLAKAIPSFSDVNYGHAEWFFGQSDEIPLYAGYTLGFELVSRYISKQGRKASRLYDEPAEHFRSLA